MTRTDVDSLPDDPAELKRMMKDIISERELLEYRLDQLLHKRYGASREKHSPNQKTLFELGTEDVAGEPVEENEESETSPRPSRRNGRRRLPADLPRERVELELSEADRCCPDCGEVRQQIGWEVSEQVEYVPAKLYVIENARAKYACKICQEHVTIAPKPATPIDKGMAGPGLLAALVVGKYGDHLPLYRMEEILSRSGLCISRSTQSDWMRRVAELTRPIVDRMKQEVLNSPIIWTNDTTLPVLDPDRDSTKTGRLWVYLGDLNHRYAVFDYSPDRKGQRPREFLAGFAGYLQADAYSGYNELCERGPVTEVACWAHARRKFHEAKAVARVGATYAMDQIGQLYGLEKKAQKVDATRRRELRQKHALPRLEKFKTWLDQQAEELLPKSPLRAAVQYARNQWEALCRYTEHGDLTIDNNLSERTLRCVAVGRKNWLFAGSDRGGQTAATLFSLIATCKLRHVDPYHYLRDILTRLPQQDVTSVDDLLPDHWLTQHPEAKLVEHRR